MHYKMLCSQLRMQKHEQLPLNLIATLTANYCDSQKQTLDLGQLEQEHTHAVSESELVEKVHTLKTDNKEDDFDFGNGPSAPTLLPESNPDKTDSLYPTIKT